MIRTGRARVNYFIGSHPPQWTRAAGSTTILTPEARVQEWYVYGAVFKHAEDNIGSVKFYPPEFEPGDISGGLWGMVEVDLDDVPEHKDEWSGMGRATVTIGIQKDRGDIYLARDVAHLLSHNFAGATIPITSAERAGGRAGDAIGYARFRDAESLPLGEADGVISHLWECEFQVFNNL